MAFRNPAIARVRPADARAFALFLQVGLARRNAVHGQRQPPRRRERFRALIDQAFGDQLVGDHAAQIVGRLRLHPRGNFFGEKFEQKIGHRSRPASPLRCATQASPQALASSRTRMM